jgi:UDP-N-acetylglucosamine--N-acetylmuramyl-(pentapeptide) pyrophosphoryl-undecaprenol N-acetylglucosamine transferase
MPVPDIPNHERGVSMTILDTTKLHEDAREAAPFAGLGLGGSRLLAVASTGGHLAQIVKIANAIGVADDTLFVTFESPQSDLLLRGKRVAFVPYIAPRDWRGIRMAAPVIRQLLDAEAFDACLSTGAGIALSALPHARLAGVRSLFIESLSRFDGPSLSGRLLAKWPGVETFTQHPEWASKRWKYAGDVAPHLDGPRVQLPTLGAAPLRVLVSLGTIQPYRFDALIDAVLSSLPASSEVVWQLGCTTRDDLPGEVHETMPADEFVAAAEAADLVISHSGVGTAMALVDMGKPTILVPRRAARGEHVDDHQLQVCRALADRRLVLHAEADELDLKSLFGVP